MLKERIPTQKQIWQVAEDNGWHNPSATFGEDIALIHSEASEALEAYRNQEGDGRIAEELADVIIRVFHLAEKQGIDIEDAVWEKHVKNKQRPYRHGDKVL